MKHVDLSLYHGCLQVTSVLKRRIATKHKLYNVEVLEYVESQAFQLIHAH